MSHCAYAGCIGTAACRIPGHREFLERYGPPPIALLRAAKAETDELKAEVERLGEWLDQAHEDR